MISAAGLARQKTPEDVQLVAELPKTLSGKVRKDELRKRALGLRTRLIASERYGGTGVYRRKTTLFREEVRQFLRIVSLRISRSASRRAFISIEPMLRTGAATLYRKGWVAPNWPKQFGGKRRRIQKYIFEVGAVWPQRAGGQPHRAVDGRARVVPFRLARAATAVSRSRSCAATRGSARASPNRRLAPTWLACVRARLLTARTMSCGCRRPGLRLHTWLTT